MDIKSGAATVYGVLYQILGSIERASNLYLQGHVEDENLLDAKLILEPSDGGREENGRLERLSKK